MSRGLTDVRSAVDAKTLAWTVGFACALAIGAAAAAQTTSAVRPVTVPSTQATEATMAEALAYEHGEGVDKDPLKAASLYCDAARAGNVDATFNLGWMYANGRGVARDDGVAAALFANAAQHGHAQAREMLRVVGAPGSLPDCLRAAETQAGARDNEIADPFAAMPPEKRKVADVVMRSAPMYTIEPALALAVITAESNFQSDARSDKGALGVMQLIPATAERFNVSNRLDIADNVQGGLAYLRWLLAYYEGHVPLAVAAYNAGENAVDRYRGIPPYPETREYVARVLRLYPLDRHVYDPRFAEPSTFLNSSADLK